MECKVAGVTFEGRQDVIGRLLGFEPVRVIPEPDNAYDPNALAVYAVIMGDPQQIGYVPAADAAALAGQIPETGVDGDIVQIAGKPGKQGVLIQFDVPAAGGGS